MSTSTEFNEKYKKTIIQVNTKVLRQPHSVGSGGKSRNLKMMTMAMATMIMIMAMITKIMMMMMMMMRRMMSMTMMMMTMHLAMISKIVLTSLSMPGLNPAWAPLHKQMIRKVNNMRT